MLLAVMAASGQIYTGGDGDGATMSCVPPKVTLLTPTDLTCVGDTVEMKVHATGTDVRYKWQKKGANFFEDLEENEKFIGVNTDFLRIVHPTMAADSGLYQCLVVNSCDKDTSEVVHMLPNRAPWLREKMSLYDQMHHVCIGSGPLNLIPSIESEANDLTYNWRRVDTLTGRSVTLDSHSEFYTVDVTPPATDAEGLYVVEAMNACGEVADSVFLPVLDVPRVKWEDQLGSGLLELCVDELLPLRGYVTGGGSYSFDLQKVRKDPYTDTWGVTSHSPLPTIERITFRAQKSHEGLYRWAVMNECSMEPSYSEILEVRVGDKPSFATPTDVVKIPDDATVCEGGRLELTARAGGTNVKYYWTKDGVRIPGADSNVLIIDDMPVDGGGKYNCIAYNNCQATASTPAIFVTVEPRPRFDRDPYLLKRACVGDSVTFFNVRPDASTDSIRWYFNHHPIYDNGHYMYTDDMNEMFRVFSANEEDVGQYQVRAYNKCGSTMSEVAHLENFSIPVAFTKGTSGYNMLLCAGMEQYLKVKTVGTQPIHYRWILNEHVYETDADSVRVQGNDIVEKNRYRIYAYNECATVQDSGWVYVEVFEHFKLSGSGEYCEGHDPNGHLSLEKSADSLEYTLYRNFKNIYGQAMETRKGTGGELKFKDMPGGTYYMMATNPKTECSQEMSGRPMVVENPAPKRPNLFISSNYCMGSHGADIVLDEWEKGVTYALERNQGKQTNYQFVKVPYSTFTGGLNIYSTPELNSPAEGEPRVYEGMDFGRYRVVATGENGCTTTETLADSIYLLPPPSQHRLHVMYGDSVNCRIPMADGTIHEEFSELEVDRFISGATYTLYRNGAKDTDPNHEPDRTSPIGWSHVYEGEYYVEVKTKEGCVGTTNKVRIHRVDAPATQTLSLSGSPCAEKDTDGAYKTLTINATEVGVKYEVYRRDPFKKWKEFDGDGNPHDVNIPNEKATYYVKAIDATGMCVTNFKDDITALPSNFTVTMNPADVFLDAKGLTTWLHFDVNGDKVEPLTVSWDNENLLQARGRLYYDDGRNPLRDRQTTPVDNDRTYTVTVTDGAGCTHSDQATVRVLGGQLRANILFSTRHRCCWSWYWGWYWCNYQHWNDQRGCIIRTTRDHCRYYYCCTDTPATDTVVWRNDEQFFCSYAKGGDYVYEKHWSFDSPGDTGASWEGRTGDSVCFVAKESGWLRLRVTSMGQEVIDSIWIDVWRRPFNAYITDADDNRLDSLYICTSEIGNYGIPLYAHTEGGDAETLLQWWGNGLTGPNTVRWDLFPLNSGWFYLNARNEDVSIRDSVYILIKQAPEKPVIDDERNVRCVVPGKSEEIVVAAPTQVGANYILEYSMDNGSSFTEMDRYNNSQGGAISFRVAKPIAYAGLYRVRAETVAGDKICPAYSKPIEFITPPSHDDITKTRYCEGTQLSLQLNSTDEGMSYSILSDRGVNFETINAPRDYFKKPFGFGDYKIVYTRNGRYPFANGLTESCSDTADFTITKVDVPEQLEISVNDGGLVCEGGLADIKIFPIPAKDQEDVTYYIQSSSGIRIPDEFVIDGDTARVSFHDAAYGTYRVYGEREGCSTMVTWFANHRNPRTITHSDVAYCVPNGEESIDEGTTLTFNNLEADVTYVLKLGGVPTGDTIYGPGTKSIEKVAPNTKDDRKYTIFAYNNETGCFSEDGAPFTVRANPNPQPFALTADCEVPKNFTLQHGSTNVRYTLYRDGAQVSVVDGNGQPNLALGAFNETGVYSAKAVDTLTGCRSDMENTVVIKGIDKSCELQSLYPICNALKPTELMWPCSTEGWTYYLKFTNRKHLEVRSESMPGTGGPLTWSTVGGEFIKLVNNKPTVYSLWADDGLGCESVLVDEITLEKVTPPTGGLKIENVLSFDKNKHSVETCPTTWEEVFLCREQEEAKYTLYGFINGYRQKLTEYVGTTTAPKNDNTPTHSLGMYKGFESYILVRELEGCAGDEEKIDMEYLEAPERSRLYGEDVCANEGVLELGADRAPLHNYYLYHEGNPEPVDTLHWNEDFNLIDFNPQTSEGRYFVIAENVDATTHIPLCQDTLSPTFSLGHAPVAYDLTSMDENEPHDVYICKGDVKYIWLHGTESPVNYEVYRDGVFAFALENKHKYGSAMEFPVREAGVYTVIGRLADCVQPMKDSVVVHVDTLPDLWMYEKYYYCAGEEGAKIEIEEAPYGCIFDLKDAGLGGPIIESDTVKRYWGDRVSDTISFNHLCPQGENYQYVVQFRTRGGCHSEHYFQVERLDPPKPVGIISSTLAVCEGECTNFAITEEQRLVQYELMKIDPDGDYSYDNMFILGSEDKKEPKWFDGSVCEKGDYYMVATYFGRFRCHTNLKINGLDTIHLLQADTIFERDLEERELHYCAGRSDGAIVRLLNAQAGIEYRLVREDQTPEVAVDWPVRVCSTDGETIEWSNVPALELCREGSYGWDNGTRYSVWGRNPATGCSKWMKGSVTVIGDRRPEVDAFGMPMETYCEGDGEILAKVRASGCGLSYQWFCEQPDGNIVSYPGDSPDLREPGSTGDYYCEVSNSCGTTKSESIFVDVQPLVEMLDGKMTPTVLCEGESTFIYSTFGNVLDGNYEWTKLGHPETILGTKMQLPVNNVSTADAGTYVVKGKGRCNELNDTIDVVVHPNVDSVNIAVEYDTICTGTTRSIHVDLNGFKVSWLHDGSPAEIGVREISRTFRKKDAGLYSISIESQSCGSRDLIPVAKIEVDSTIDFDWKTEDRHLCSGDQLDYLEVHTLPMAGVKYVWEQIIGDEKTVIGHNYDVRVQIPADVAHITYRCFYSNTCNRLLPGAQYQDINVNVNTNIQATTPWDSEMTFCQGDGSSAADRTLTATIEGVSVQNYVWEFRPAGSTECDTVLQGESANSYEIPDLREASGHYTCVMQTDCGRMRYPYDTWVRINTPARFIDQISGGGRMCEGATFAPTVHAQGSDLQFRWLISKYQTGHRDTILKEMGYEWEDGTTLRLNSDDEYVNDTIYCVVYNNCGIDSTAKVPLSIEKPRYLQVDPETWVCYDSLATVKVRMMDAGNVPYITDSWSYTAQCATYNPLDRVVTKGLSDDTLRQVRAGHWLITNIEDGVCEYDKDTVTFDVHELPFAKGSFGFSDGVRDTTVCAMSNIEFLVKVTGGNGPFSAELQYKPDGDIEWKKYDQWFENPKTISLDEAHNGYNFSTKIVIDTPAEFRVVLHDLNNNKGVGDGCETFIDYDYEVNTVKVKVVKSSVVRMEVKDFMLTEIGWCKLPLYFNQVFDPGHVGGTYHVTKKGVNTRPDSLYDEPYSGCIAPQDGPGTYMVKYSTGGKCDENSLNEVRIIVREPLKIWFEPTDTVFCYGLNHVLHLRSNEPMLKVKITQERLLKDGTKRPANKATTQEYGIGTGLCEADFATDHWLYDKVTDFVDQKDSIIYIKVDEATDRYGCTASGNPVASTTMGIDYPTRMRVEGYHKDNYGGIYKEEPTFFNIHEGDTVLLRLTLVSGYAPWTYGLLTGPASDGSNDVKTTVYGRDTVICLTEATDYGVRLEEDRYGCTPGMGPDVVFHIQVDPDGYLEMDYVFLGGPLGDPELTKNYTLYNIAPFAPGYKPLMQSSVASLNVTGHGLTPYAMTKQSKFIDWVEVRLLEYGPDDKFSIFARDTCVLLNTGVLMGRDGYTTLRFPKAGTAGKLYYVAVYHRNHLPMMFKNPVQLGSVPSAAPSLHLAQNPWTSDGNLDNHYWRIDAAGTYWALSPAAKIVAQADLVTMLNSDESFFFDMLNGYNAFDVNLDGVVDFKPFITNGDWSEYISYTSSKDGWLLCKGRNKYPEF